MRRTPIIAGIAAGAIAGLGGALAAELATENAEAQSGRQFATKAELKASDLRSRAAINIGKRTWNLATRHLAEKDEIVGAKDGPIRQLGGTGDGQIPGQGGGDGTPGPQGPQGPAGPSGPTGPQGPQGPSSAYYRTFVGDTISATGETELATLSLPPGSYVASANVSGFPDVDPMEQNYVACFLRTPEDNGGPRPGMTLDDAATFPLYALTPQWSFETATATTLMLRCYADGVAPAAAGSISAVAVGELTEEPPIDLLN